MPLPELILDDKTFNELFDEARGLIPRYAQDWTDHNPSDPGVTLIDLFAWLAEMQIYFLDRVTDKNYVKFLRLLGQPPTPASPAAAQLTFTLSDPKAAPFIVPKGTQVAAVDSDTAERIIFETGEDVLVHFGALQSALTRAGGRWVDNSAANQTVGVPYFAFGEEPRRGDRLYLGLAAGRALPAGVVKLVVNVYTSGAASSPVGGARNDPSSKLVPSAKLEWEYHAGGGEWRPLSVDDQTVALTRDGGIGLTVPEDIAAERIRNLEKGFPAVADEELYWLRVSVVEPGYELPPRLDTVAVNTVAATHGKTIPHEHSSSSGLPSQQVKLRNRPVLHRTVRLRVREDERKHAGEKERWRRWTEVDDFDASGPEDRHFTVDPSGGLIKFGDGVRGRIPPAVKEDDGGNICVVKYRVGGGVRGNVAAKAINELVAEKLKGMLQAVNPRAAKGGAEAEPLPDAKSRARRSLKEVTRGVTTDDFESLASKTPGAPVARVKVLPQYDPRFPAIEMPGAVTLVVVPETPTGRKLPEPSAGFLKNVFNHLKAKSLVSTNLSVIGPEFVEVTVKAVVRVESRTRAEDVRKSVVEALGTFLNPLTGGHDGKGWPFGRPVYKTEIYQLIEGVKGVDCVERVTLSGESCDSSRPDPITLRKIALVYSGEHEVAAC